MPISGLVVTLSPDPQVREAACAAMRAHPALELGELLRGRAPVVVESSDENEDRLVWEWLHALPGVEMVVVAFIHFDDDPVGTETSYLPAGLASEGLGIGKEWEI